MALEYSYWFHGGGAYCGGRTCKHAFRAQRGPGLPKRMRVGGGAAALAGCGARMLGGGPQANWALPALQPAWLLLTLAPPTRSPSY